MNENLKWFLFEMSAYLSTIDNSAFTISNMGIDLFRNGKYIRGNITGVGEAVWDSTGKLVYPTSFSTGVKNLVLKMDYDDMQQEGVTPEYLQIFFDATQDEVYNYTGSNNVDIEEYYVGVNKSILRMVGQSDGLDLEWSPSGEPLNQTSDHKLGYVSEISNYNQLDGVSPNFSETVLTQYSGGLNTVVGAQVIVLEEFFTGLDLTVEEYRGAIGSSPNRWDGSGNHLTDSTLNMVDIVTTTDFQNNY